MKRTKPLIAFITVAVAAWLVLVVVPDDGARTAAPLDGPGSMAEGYVVHVDPQTGRIEQQSQSTFPVAADSKMQHRLSTSSEGLVETPSPVPGGGVMVDLEGRFMNTFVATVDDSGGVEVFCTTDAAESVSGGGGGQ
jgi:hypothetical protein